CDQKWPTCTQCIRKGVRCPGPSSMVKFVPPVRPPDAGSSKVPESAEPPQLAMMVSRGPMRPYGDGGAIEWSFRLKLPRPVMSTAADRVGSQLISLYEEKDTSVFGSPTYLEFCPQRLSQSSCLVDCVEFYCDNWVKANLGRPEYELFGSRLFKKAIRSLQSAINSDKAYTVETLASMILLYRVLIYTGAHSRDSGNHHRGIRHVAKQMGVPRKGDLLHASLIDQALSYLPEESPWREQVLGLEPPFWERDSEEEVEANHGELDWDPTAEIMAEYEDSPEKAVEAFNAANDEFSVVYGYLNRFWWPQLFEIWRNPVGMADKSTSLMEQISKAEIVFGKSMNKAWRACLSLEIIEKSQNPNFFLGYTYSFEDFGIFREFLMMIQAYSVLVLILYELGQHLGSREDALYDKHRDLCVRIWACIPSMSEWDPVSALGLFGIMFPTFGPATDEELGHILDLNIRLGGIITTRDMTVQAFRPHIDSAVRKYTGRERFAATLSDDWA
ncbi:unnamed protein product, partial [Clonostachys rosea]